jgi:hypothetical protein
VIRMKIEQNPTNTFATEFTGFQIVGFHATSSLACADIERSGFLPNKILSANEHDQILSAAKSLEINTFSYEEWLGMRSVTFTKEFQTARNHILQGNSGGQGLFNVINVLEKIKKAGNPQQVVMASDFVSKTQQIRSSSCVIYAVDLSGLGQRLVHDKEQSGLYQVYFDPNSPLPNTSIVAPSCIIARLNLSYICPAT